MPDRTTAIAGAFELSLLIGGTVLLWRLWLSPKARSGTRTAALPAWSAPIGEFLLFVWLVCAGGFALSFGAGLVLRQLTLEPDAIVAIGTAAAQIGVLAGILCFKTFFDRHKSSPPAARGFFVSGLATFLIAMPVVAVTALAWKTLLEKLGLPDEKQDLIRMLLEADSPALLVVMIVLACVGAPVMEELVFRAGLFRYVRTRLPRTLALLLPACLFAALHRNLASFVPLVALGVLFSLAYERTGRIGTSIVAHALFNLNSLVLILAKVDL